MRQLIYYFFQDSTMSTVASAIYKTDWPEICNCVIWETTFYWLIGFSREWTWVLLLQNYDWMPGSGSNHRPKSTLHLILAIFFKFNYHGPTRRLRRSCNCHKSQICVQPIIVTRLYWPFITWSFIMLSMQLKI